VVGEADGYVIVSPEYNHGYSAVLKNALDWVYTEWTKKPVGFVGYGSTGGARAIEQLRQVVVELDMVPLREAIHVPLEVYLAVMKETAPAAPELFKPLREGMFGDRVATFRLGRDPRCPERLAVRKSPSCRAAAVPTGRILSLAPVVVLPPTRTRPAS
jgi:NAD(P)H-dependent FMN reductase